MTNVLKLRWFTIELARIGTRERANLSDQEQNTPNKRENSLAVTIQSITAIPEISNMQSGLYKRFTSTNVMAGKCFPNTAR